MCHLFYWVFSSPTRREYNWRHNLIQLSVTGEILINHVGTELYYSKSCGLKVARRKREIPNRLKVVKVRTGR